MQKNVTLKLPEETLRWARIEAAKKGTSVSALVGNMLEQERRKTDDYWRSYEEWKATMAKIDAGEGGCGAARRMSREETHDRETGP